MKNRKAANKSFESVRLMGMDRTTEKNGRPKERVMDDEKMMTSGKGDDIANLLLQVWRSETWSLFWSLQIKITSEWAICSDFQG